MTTYNKKKSILERGGMMIEALAMLGLIAVVTPTMYKKSAERTLEVEDINTATQMRTYMNAVDAFISDNYFGIMADMKQHNTSRQTYQLSKLKEFLPYGYATTNKLYDYGEPTISVVKDGNNLTGFILFPAKDENGGIGRERTARIASLIGANGGYVRDSKDARGVGGVWALNEAAYDKVFPSSANLNSIVIATANPISGNAQGELDNDKYLQRTRESDDDSELWRNTMRTDLYLGGYAEHDPKQNDDTESTLHSIRNVNSLIIGAEDGEGDNGLYIADSATKKNAYIGGTLKALAEKFVVDTNGLSYGDYGEGYAAKFMVDNQNGFLSYGKDATNDYFKVTKEGDLTQYGNVNMATNFIDGNGTVSIGKKGNKNFVLDAVRADDATTVKLVFSNSSTDYFKITKGSPEEQINDKIKLPANHLYMMKNVFAQINENGTLRQVNVYPKYNYEQQYPIVMGSNALARGLFTATFVDTNQLRSMSLKTGSDTIDDANKWLDVGSNGVKMYSTDARDINNKSKVAVDINDDGLAVRAGRNDPQNDKREAVLTVQNTDNSQANSQIRASANSIRLKANNDAGDVTIMTPKIAQMVKDNEIIIGNHNTFPSDDMGLETDEHDEAYPYRVVYGKGGNVDLVDTNLNIVKTDGNKVYNVLSVGGNNQTNDAYSDGYVTGASYDMAVHGNAVFTSQKTSQNNTVQYNYMSIGKPSNNSGVNIVADGGTQIKPNEQVMVVDLKEYSDSDTAYSNEPRIIANLNHVTYPGSDGRPTLSSGSVYIRKGMVNIIPQIPGSGTVPATEGKGVVKASRFVANNVDTNGNPIQVKKILGDTIYNQYNDITLSENEKEHRVRYDTYMVNPAYTSVMHDIKLTTRGGARLSDVLPDFITKGIYIATNDYDDDLINFEFKMNTKDEYKNDMAKVTVGGDEPKRTSSWWASPYAGSVPAPQCPPGYGRVITVNPVGIQMAEAGDISLKTGTGDGSSPWGVEPSIMRREGFNGATKEEIDKLKPSYAPMKVGVGQDGNKLYGSLADSDSADDPGVSKVYHVTGVKGLPVVADGYSERPFILAAKGEAGLKPLVFQQNTHLKTLAVPVCTTGSTKVGENCGENNYTRGWAILMGFVYTADWVQVYLGENVTGGYWNLFPVEKNKLEASVSTYCYFDRTNILSNAFQGDYDSIVDPYHPVQRTTPDSFEKQADKDYLDRLNDPTLKYNEVW